MTLCRTHRAKFVKLIEGQAPCQQKPRGQLAAGFLFFSLSLLFHPCHLVLSSYLVILPCHLTWSSYLVIPLGMLTKPTTNSDNIPLDVAEYPKPFAGDLDEPLLPVPTS